MVFERPMPPPKRTSPYPRVRLQRRDFNVPAALAALKRPDCGAAVVYLGTVRSSPHGGGPGRVVRLEYEAFEPMALAKLAEVRRLALLRFAAKDLLIHHRTGTLGVGENVVLCVAVAPHREEALAAARFAIAEMKQSVPIWKKEIYRGGRAKWVVGEMRPKEVLSRQTRARR